MLMIGQGGGDGSLGTVTQAEQISLHSPGHSSQQSWASKKGLQGKAVSGSVEGEAASDSDLCHIWGSAISSGIQGKKCGREKKLVFLLNVRKRETEITWQQSADTGSE